MSTIHFELVRLFTRKTIGVFFLLVIVSLYFTFQGVSEYRNFQESKNDFITAEKEKNKFYLTYEQYGATGFRVILERSALSVFFNRHDFTRDIEGLIDTSEILKIYNGRKGKKAFSIESGFGDLNYSISIFGTLIMMIMGFLSFPNKFNIEYFPKRNHIKTIFARLLLLDIFFILLLTLVYCFARGSGVAFLPHENWFFIGYGCVVLLLLDIFFFLGLIIKVFSKYKKNALNILMITWFVIVLALPELGQISHSIKLSQLPSAEKLELEKLRTLLNSELINRVRIHDFLSSNNIDVNMKPVSLELKKVMKDLYQYYMNNGYKLNQKKEADFLQKVKQDIDLFSFLNALFPVEFINSFSSEISGEGNKAYLGFCKYLSDLKDQFMVFYGQKRYESTTEAMPLEPFVKNSENIYQSRGNLPGYLQLGMSVMLLYILILAGLAFWRIRAKKTKVAPLEIPSNIKHGHMLFLLVNKAKQKEIVLALKQEKRSYLHEESLHIMNEEVTAKRFIDYACCEKKLDKSKVLENLKLFAVPDEYLHNKLSLYPEECKRKLICSLVFAEANEVIIIDDFLKGVSAELEKQFFDLVTREAKMDRKVIYIGSEIYTPTSSLIKLDMNIKTYRPFQLEPQKVSLR
jgi:hypothetical protein